MSEFFNNPGIPEVIIFLVILLVIDSIIQEIF